MSRRFDDDGVCGECGEHSSLHSMLQVAGAEPLFACPDPYLVERLFQDDPWQPSAYEPEPPIAEYFDLVCV